MTLVKICGLTTLEDARTAVAAGADYLGFIFYPPSPRAISLEAAGALLRELRTSEVFLERRTAGPLPRLVGVFVNEPAEVVAAVLDTCELDFAQLSGDESLAMLADVASPLAGRAYKALRARTLDEVLTAAQAIPAIPTAAPSLPRLLLDAPHTTLYGGTGQVADWGLAAEVVRRLSTVMLAGGLNPDNVAEAVRQVRPFAVDVAGGVEASPGRKDHAKVRAFVAAVRASTHATATTHEAERL